MLKLHLLSSLQEASSMSSPALGTLSSIITFHPPLVSS
ncbi:hypothetical protein LINPERPRIM_LOCUS35849 [Linum perenne]